MEKENKDNRPINLPDRQPLPTIYNEQATSFPSRSTGEKCSFTVNNEKVKKCACKPFFLASILKWFS